MRFAIVACTAAAALLTATAASAAVEISIGYSYNGGSVVSLANGFVTPGDTLNYTGPLTKGAFKIQSIDTSFGPMPDLLNTEAKVSALNATCASPCTLDIYVTMQNLQPWMLGDNTLISSLAATTGNKTTLSTFYNADNALWGKETALQHVYYTGVTGVSGDNTEDPSGLFSVTEQFHLTKLSNTALTNTMHATIDLGTNPVPEPATWALMILGFGSTGAMLRRRRMSLAAA
jgi:hypothetical protein